MHPRQPEHQPSKLRIADLPSSTRDWLAKQRFDQSIEKHEGPWNWDDLLEAKTYEDQRFPSAEFLQIDGHDVLLPIGSDHHPSLQLLRVIVGDKGSSLTLFMKDTTYGDDYFTAGRVAICDRIPNGEWYLCHFWHKWYDPSPS
jgi:hypothetical protein